jgi:hypothetical protein
MQWKATAGAFINRFPEICTNKIGRMPADSRLIMEKLFQPEIRS